MTAPIAVFAFNRPEHLASVLAALAANDLGAESDVTVFCDGERGPMDRDACARVREVAHEAIGFRQLTVVAREANLGCAGSVIRATNEMFQRHDRLVVIEDDILAEPRALSFLNESLERFEAAPSVFSISAWSPPPRLLRVPADYRFDSYFVRRFHCWGWASWRSRWSLNDWTVPGYEAYRRDRAMRASHAEGGADLPGMLDAQMAGRIDSWAIRAEYTRFLTGTVTLYPRHSLVKNIGFDGSGRHCGKQDHFRSSAGPEAGKAGSAFSPAVYVDKRIAAAFRAVYSRRRVLNRLLRMLRLQG